MNAAELIARKMADRKTQGLLVVLTYEGRPPFNYFARNIEERDDFVKRAELMLGKPDRLGHVLRAIS